MDSLPDRHGRQQPVAERLRHLAQQGRDLHAPASYTFSANAADTDGSVTKVEFFRGTTLGRHRYVGAVLGHRVELGQGNYTLTAKATDNNDAATTSSPW